MSKKYQKQVEDQPITTADGELLNPLPKRYQQQLHDQIPMSFSCRKCRLGQKQESRNLSAEEEGKPQNVTVCGAGPDDLSKIKLIVISDYPGAYESAPNRAYPMFDNRLRPREDGGIPNRLNAGALIRWALWEMFQLDSYTDCWFTNSLRCNPQEVTPMEADTKTCALTWGKTEIGILDQYVPEVPILVAGSIAFKSLRYLFPMEWKYLSSLGQNECRRRSDLRVGEHPIVVTQNPASAARSDMLYEVAVRPARTGGLVVSAAEYVRPFMPLSPLWHFGMDLMFLEEFLVGG